MGPARRNSLSWAGLAGLLLFGAAGVSMGQDAERPSDPRLSRQLAVEVRAAMVGDLTSKLSTALGVQMSAEPDMSGHRVTLLASRTTLLGLQQALASLFGSTWATGGQGLEIRYHLASNDPLQTRAERLRQQRRSRFVARLLQTEDSLRRRKPETVAAALQAELAARVPHFSPETLEEISPDYLRQSMLLRPLRLGLTANLARTGFAWILFRNLSAGYQQLLASFAVEQYQESREAQTAASENVRVGTVEDPGPLILNYPQARAEYRILHGDRWTGSLMQVRVGAPGHWATAVLPSILYELPDYATLYPETTVRPGGVEIGKPLTISIDTDRQTWDQALTTVARAAGINVVTDSYLRPEIFRPAGDGPVIRGTTLGDTLSQLAEYYGYAWWKHGDWYVFRSRLWADEERVAFPDRLSQSMAASIAARDRLSQAEIAELGTLTDEQLLSMHLYGSAAGRPYAPEEAFDLDAVQLARAGLILFGQMNAQQRELARGPGIPFPLMTPNQQGLFAAIATERALVLDPYAQEAWRFRVAEQFRRERLPAGAADIGALQVFFEYGQAGTRRAELAIRVPGLEVASGTERSPQN
jgi:hypothetical protein